MQLSIKALSLANFVPLDSVRSRIKLLSVTYRGGLCIKILYVIPNHRTALPLSYRVIRITLVECYLGDPGGTRTPNNFLIYNHVFTNEPPLLLRRLLSHKIQPVRYLSPAGYSAVLHDTRLCTFLVGTAQPPLLACSDYVALLIRLTPSSV